MVMVGNKLRGEEEILIDEIMTFVAVFKKKIKFLDNFENTSLYDTNKE